MAGICIDKLPHSCGTTKGLQVFADPETGKVNGFCFSCRKFVANPYGTEKTIDEVELPEPKSEAEIAAEMAEVDGFPVVDVSKRKLRASDLTDWGIKVSLSEEDGETPYGIYFPMERDGVLSGYYVKTLSEPSYTFAIGDVKAAEPFGWGRAKRSGAYRLIITEGLVDAPSVEKIYRTHTKAGEEEWIPAVISLPNGVNSVKSLSKIADVAKKKFKEIVICFDDDEPGRKATQEAMVIFPDAMSVTLPYKDANDCVLNGAMKAAYKMLRFEAKAPKNTRLLSARDIHMLAREPTPYGALTWPFPTMQKLLRGIRYGETIYIGAGVKMGKSALLNTLAAHFIKTDNVPVFLAKPEEEYKKTYKLIAGSTVGAVFDDPDIEFDYEAYDKAGKVLEDKLIILDLYQHLGWESLRQDIVHAANRGCRAIFIDPITNLTNGVDSGEANTQLQAISQALSALAHDLNVVIFIFCHLKAPEGNLSKDMRQLKYKKGEFYNLGNCPHELGGDVLSAQFAGSRAMMRSCNLMLGLAGNKDPDLDETTRRMRWLTILEDREFGNSAHVPLLWNRHTTFYREV